MGDKTCNKCGKTGLGWNQEFHKEEGRWILDYHQDRGGRWCSKKKTVWINLLKGDIKQCELCSGTNMGWLLTEEAHLKNPNFHYISIKEHNRMFHIIE